jgi:cytochrome d ubiquinol oxidase subunit I
MDEVAVLWSRIQFAITNMFHYIYPPLSIGLGTFLVITATLYMITRKPVWAQVTRFWIKVFALTFTIGVATGIPMEFQFGTNWATYSRFVGDVFGSALAAEGLFAFFLESGFLALVLFGAGRIPPWLHWFSILMVCLGAHFSAVWIVVAGSWMHTPSGFEIVEGPFGLRAEVTDFWAMVFNPSAMTRLLHVLMGCWLGGAFLVTSVSAWYLLHKRHLEFAKASMKVALLIAVPIALGQAFVSGDWSAKLVAKHQPAKFAAMEGIWPEYEPAEMVIFGYIDEDAERTVGPSIPGMTSWLLTRDPHSPVTGLKAFPPEDRPPLQITFQAYHLMISIGMWLIMLSLAGAFLWWRGTLWKNRLVLWLFVFSVLAPIIANESGWVTAEVGRQPWIVQGVMRTSDAVSPNLTGGQVIRSTIMFTLIYMFLASVFIYTLHHKIQHGPEPAEATGPMVSLPARLRERFQELFKRPRAQD